jgi:hypothetical protein
MREIDEYLSIKKCDCGRSYCKFFSGLIGESGESFSVNAIEHEIREIEEFKKGSAKALKHLKSLLKPTPPL